LNKFLSLIALTVVGSLLLIAAFFAPELGLDRSPGWGRARWSLLAASLLLFMIALALRNAALTSWTAFIRGPRQRTSTAADRHPLLHRFGVGLSLLIVVCIAVFAMWYGSAGLFPFFPPVHNDYADLGDAFLRGQLALLEVPSAELQALPDPYPLSVRIHIDHRWDASYYDHKYYLYWGPVPAILSAGLQLLGGTLPSGALLVALAYLLLLGFFFALLLRLWTRHLRAPSSLWLGPFTAAGLLGFPMLFQLGQSRVYEASILYGQAFLFAGLLFWEVYRDRPAPFWLLLAGLAWTLAIGSRYNLLISIACFIVFIFFWIRNHGPHWNHAWALLSPLLLGMILYAVYNWLRFDDPLETGKAYQLTVNAMQGLEYSPSYLPSSLYIYLLYPLTIASRFPFVRSALFDAHRVPGWIPMPATRVFDHVLFGTLPAAPVIALVVLSFVPLASSILRGRRIRQSLPPAVGWESSWAMLASAAALQFLFIALYYYGAERFVGDFYLLSVLTAALAFERLDADLLHLRPLRLGLWLMALILVVWTVATGCLGAFGVPPKTFSLENPVVYSRLASSWNDRWLMWQSLLERVTALTGQP
jgi:hypothetical protein